VKDFFQRATSRKFIAFVATTITLGVLAWYGKPGADGWTIAAVFGSYVGAQGLVDHAAARRKAGQ
jgi:hypothetical protein